MVVMIVDAHTHLWQSPDQLGPHITRQLRRTPAEPWRMTDADPQAHEQAMATVDVAFVVGVRSRWLGADVPNRDVAAYVKQRPHARVGFAAIDPMADDWREQFDQAESLGLAGVCVNPAGQDFHPTHSRAMRLYDACRERGMPVMVQHGPCLTAMCKLEYARPHLLDEVARSMPDLKLIVGHCGHPWAEESLALIGKHENVYADLSDVVGRPWQLYNVLLMAHQMAVTDHMLFGSGFPARSPQEAIATIYSLNQLVHGTGLPSVPRERLRGIVERDVPACLGIARPPAPAAEPAADRAAAAKPDVNRLVKETHG